MVVYLCGMKWKKDMQYLGPNLITGIKNLLFYPDNILYDDMISDEPEFEDEEEGEVVSTKEIILKMGTIGSRKKKKKRKNKSKRK